jgi:hypothetical protein
MLWTAGQTVLVPQGGYRFALGFSDGTNSYSFGAASQNAVTKAAVRRRLAKKALTIVDWTGTTLAEANLASWTSAAFTLNWTTNDTRPVVIHYLLIGGPNVSAKAVNWTMPLATGNKAVTGIGFKPDLVFHSHQGTGLTGAPPSTSGNASLTLGAMNAAGEQWSFTSLAVDAANTTLHTSDTYRTQRTDAALVAIEDTPLLLVKGAFASMDADGFTMSWSQVDTIAGQIISLALRGVRSKVTSFAKATTVTSQAVTTAGFQPSAVLLASFDAAATTSVLGDGRVVLGASDGAIEATSGLVDVNALPTTSASSVDKTSKAYCSLTNAGAVGAEADVSGFLANGVDLSWTTNAAPASQVLAVFLGAP